MGAVCRASRGFTLIELVVLMIVISVIAVVALPRFTGTDAFDQRGLHDETLALLRYAQKAAIAQRRMVCVTFTQTGATAKMDANDDGDCVDAGDGLQGPNGSNPFTIAGEGGAQYTGTTPPASIDFDALGSPSSGLSLQVSGLPQSIRVEAQTGYVHE